jgi:aminoglycoside phosphotransferase (APT) family kinase protein
MKARGEDWEPQQVRAAGLTRGKVPWKPGAVPTGPTPVFSSASAADTLRAACARVGLASADATLLRFGSNAIFRLADQPVVVRIARDADLLPRVERELQAARWLAGLGYPAVRVAEEVEQPLVVDGRPVTFWVAIDGSESAPSVEDLADLLRRLHALPESGFPLPRFEPFTKMRRRLAATGKIPEAQRRFLRERCAQLQAAFRSLRLALPSGLIHGDAHRDNLLCRDGEPVLLDFEEVAIGPREWDLVPTAIGFQRFGLPAEDYRRFVARYGFDVVTWDGFSVLRSIREMTMTTWLMQNVDESPEIAEEFEIRVRSLREGDARRGWRVF